jgi:hypothetical protein
MGACRSLFVFDANRRRPSARRLGEFRGYCLCPQKKRFASPAPALFLVGFRPSIASLKGIDSRSLVDANCLQLRRPVKRQFDPVEQSLGT